MAEFAGLGGAKFATLHWAAAGGGLFLLIGLWTPLTGVVVGIVEFCDAFLQHGDPWMAVLVGTLALGLAMLGPGAWSIDARLCGRRRIEIRPR